MSKKRKNKKEQIMKDEVRKNGNDILATKDAGTSGHVSSTRVESNDMQHVENDTSDLSTLEKHQDGTKQDLQDERVQKNRRSNVYQVLTYAFGAATTALLIVLGMVLVGGNGPGMRGNHEFQEMSNRHEFRTKEHRDEFRKQMPDFEENNEERMDGV